MDFSILIEQIRLTNILLQFRQEKLVDLSELPTREGTMNRVNIVQPQPIY